MAVLSIMGLYNYDNTVLNGLINNLPSPGKVPIDSYPDLYYTPEPLDSDALIGELLLECAELEVLYPSVTTMSQAVNVWAITHKKVWQDYYNTMWYKYNPIWNKDGVITRTETEERQTTGNENNNGNSTETRNLQNQNTRNLTEKQSNSNSESIDETNTRTDDLSQDRTSEETRTPDLSTSGNTTHDVAGFNSNRLVTSYEDETTTKQTGTETIDVVENISNTGTQKNQKTGNNETSGTLDITQGGNQSDTETGTIDNKNENTTNRSENEKITRTYEDKETGNIGITMTQQMIDAERETVKFNIYNMIIQEFKERFCLLIY